MHHAYRVADLRQAGAAHGLSVRDDRPNVGSMRLRSIDTVHGVDWSLTISALGAVASAVAAYFAYVQVRGRIRRKHPIPPTVQARQVYDAFISYAQVDKVEATRIAEGLQNRGLRVFLAEWIDVGLIEYLEKERALEGTINGILLFSKATMSQPAVADDYAALLQRVHSNGRRFIPVLVEEVDLPPFARIRKPVDLVHSPDPSGALDQLAAAVR